MTIPPDSASVDATAIFQIVATSSSSQSARNQVEALLRDRYDAVRREAVADRRLGDD